jgi:hypothetical protein
MYVENLDILFELFVTTISTEHRTSAITLLVELCSITLVASCSRCHASVDRRSTPDFVSLSLNVCQGTRGADSFLVTEHKRIMVLAEEAVHAVYNRDETEIEDRPDDVELPVDTVDTDRSDLNNHKVHDPVRCSTESGSLCTH